MKNKLTCLIIAIFSFANTAYSLQAENETCYPESLIEISDCGFDHDAISDAYRYVTFGGGPVVFIPNIGIGYRERFSGLGWDTALSFSTIGYAHQLVGHLVGHYYLNPSMRNSAYLGLGIMTSGVVTNDKEKAWTLSPDFVFGKEFERKGDSRQFLEMHVGIPTMSISKHVRTMYFPLMYVKYGIAF